MYLICIIHIADVSLCIINASLCPMNLFSFKFVLIVYVRPVFYEISIRMLANLYKGLKTTTNALPTIRMACDLLQICCEWLQICCKYAFFANFRSMFLIFVKPQNRARMLTKANECLAITLRSMRIGCECHS